MSRLDFNALKVLNWNVFISLRDKKIRPNNGIGREVNINYI